MTIDKYTVNTYSKVVGQKDGNNIHITNDTGILSRVIITRQNKGKVVIFDNDSTTGTRIASIDASVTLGTEFNFNCTFVNGLSIRCASVTGMTVIYSA